MSPSAEGGRPRILVTGGAGQVGWELVRSLSPLGAIVVHDRRTLDLTNLAAVRDLVRAVRPTVIMNAAAYTHVDGAESEQALAHRINADAPGVMAAEVKRLGAVLVHYSTDAVFDGAATVGYSETDLPAPLNAYGRSKLAGEEAVMASGVDAYIFRVSWIYGMRGRNFLRTLQRLASGGSVLRVVDDQHGAPTWSRVVAEATAAALSQVLASRRNDVPAPPRGIYHMTAADYTTWHEFAESIVAAAFEGSASPAPVVQSIPTADDPTVAVRPRFSVLDSTKLAKTFGIQLPAWRDQFQLCLASADRPSAERGA